MMHLEDRLTSSEGHFRVISGVILGSSGGSSGGHPRVIRGSSRGHPGVTLGVIGGQFWVTLGVIRGSILGLQGSVLGGLLGYFPGVEKSKNQNMFGDSVGCSGGPKCPLIVPCLSLICPLLVVIICGRKAP